MTPEERGQSKHLVYQYLPSRYGMNPDDLRKADAIEIVLGQGAKPGGGGMLLGQKITERVAGMRTLPVGHRPALRQPAPGLDRPGRPGNQDRRTARDHRLEDAHLRQDRRLPAVLRHRPGREVRRGRGGGGRHAGRHRRDAAGVHRERRHPHPRRHPAGRPGAAGTRRPPQGPAHRLRRHPHRRRRRQGHGPRGGRRRHRHRGADRPGRQRSPLRRRIRRPGFRRRLLRRLPGRPRPRRHHHPGPGTLLPAGPGSRRHAAWPTTCAS